MKNKEQYKEKNTESNQDNDSIVREMIELYTMVPPRPGYKRKGSKSKKRKHKESERTD